MSLKATFSTGSDSTTVTGLHQWDYGQILEIESSDIGSEIVEVHFACSNMSEAIVRSCAFSNSVGTVTIPDACLEQSTTITAWVYQISGTQGHTIKTITLPIIARTRPSVAPDIPAEVCDKYTELITEVNEAVEALESGDITVAKAIDATNASHATSAGNAATANYATSSGSTDTANKLNLNCLEYLNSTVPSKIELSPGRIYVITASCVSDKTRLETMVLYISKTGELWYSSKSGGGYYCYYDGTSIKFTHSDGADTYLPSTVYIREL